MLTVCLTLAVGADPEVLALPLVRATLLRDSGCWLRWEGDAPAAKGSASFHIPDHIDASTLSVERREKDGWRTADFSVAPRVQSPKAASIVAPSDGMTSVSVIAPDNQASISLRCQAFSPSLSWRPAYHLDLVGDNARLAIRAIIQSSHATSNDAALECIASTARPKSASDERWADATTYELSAKRIARGSTSLGLFDEKVDAGEIVTVELGALVGEPALKSERDRATTRLRIVNRTPKAWPEGNLLVTKDGRLVARTTLPHADAGQSVEIPLGGAVGVSVVREEVELERKTATMRRETDPPDSIQTAGSATIVNRTGRAINVRATKTVAGDATGASDDAKIVRTANRLGLEQPLSEIRWSFTLPANQSKRLTFGTILRTPPPLELKDSRP